MAFVTSGFLGSPVGHRAVQKTCSRRRAAAVKMIVSEIGSKDDLDKALDGAGEALVVVDYSTSWCGPCKMIAPKYEKLSEENTDVVFLKVMGDADDDTAELMKIEAIRAVPAFHFWKSKEKVHTITGARADDIETAISMYK